MAEQRKTKSSNDTARLESFSDGVFAIAITLLILEIKLPGTGPLWPQLAGAWPSYVAYALSFVTIGIMWANHHTMFRLIARCTHGLIVANLLLLMTISFLPFSTHVLAEHLKDGGANTKVGAIFYSGTFLLIAVAFQILWQTVSYRNRLVAEGSEGAADEITKGYRLGIPMYTVSIVLAFWNATASIAFVSAMALFWLIPRGRDD